jgi:hypothetical protein
MIDIRGSHGLSRSNNIDLLSFRPKGEIYVPIRARNLLDFSSLRLLEMTNQVSGYQLTLYRFMILGGARYKWSKIT